MKIAIFSDSYLPQINGVVTQIKNTSEELVKRGHEILIVTPADNGKFKEKKSKGIKVIYLPSLALPSYNDYKITSIFSSKVKKELKEFKPDVIHVHTPFSVGWLGIRYGKRFKIPIIGTYHTLIPEFMMYLPIPFLNKTKFAKKTAWKYTNHFYNKCDLVTTPTLSMKKELEKNGCKNVSVLSNAINFKQFNKVKKKNYDSKKLKLIYFGRIGFEKNIEILIFALKHLVWKNYSLKLTITGSGPAVNYLKSLSKEQGLSNHVEFQKPLHEAELAKHVAKHDIFVTASTIETQGLTILESMAVGVPCVGTDYLAIPDAIKENKTGFLFSAFDFIELASKIERLLKSVSLRKRIGKNSIEEARKYSLEHIISEWEMLYTTISASKKQF